MAKGSRGGRRGGGGGNTASSANTASSGATAQTSAQSSAQDTNTAPVTPTATQGGANPVSNPGTFTNADAKAWVTTNADVDADPDFTDARKLYISAKATKTGFSMAQNLNYKLDNGIPLDPSETFMDENLQYGMRALGKDATLVRYAHDDVLKSLGISNYQNMTDAQLQAKLVGAEFQTTSYMSTSYDAVNSPFAPNQPQGGGREVTMNIKCGQNTQVFMGARKQSEIVVNRGTNYRVVGVHRDGTTAYPRLGGAKDRIVLDIETY